MKIKVKKRRKMHACLVENVNIFIARNCKMKKRAEMINGRAKIILYLLCSSS